MWVRCDHIIHHFADHPLRVATLPYGVIIHQFLLRFLQRVRHKNHFEVHAPPTGAPAGLNANIE